MAGMGLEDILAAQSLPTNKGVDVAGSLSQGIQTGIQLATAKEQIESKKVLLEQQKEQLNQAKFQSFDSMMKTLHKASGNPAVAKQLAKGMKGRFQQMGFDPAIVDVAVSDPEFSRQYQIMSEMYSGKIMGNPKALERAIVASQNLGLLSEAIAGDQAQRQRAHAAGMQDKQIASSEKIAGMQIEAKEKGAEKKMQEKAEQALRLDKNKLEEIIKKDRDALGNLSDSTNLLKTGGSISQSAARRALAKAYNSGALTDNDVNDFAGDKALASRLNQFLETNLTGDISDENLRQLLEIAEKSAQRREASIKSNAMDAAERYTYIHGGDAKELYNNYFYPKNFMNAMKDNSEGVSEQDKKAMQTINPKTGKNFTKEEIDAYKAEKGIK